MWEPQKYNSQSNYLPFRVPLQVSQQLSLQPRGSRLAPARSGGGIAPGQGMLGVSGGSCSFAIFSKISQRRGSSENTFGLSFFWVFFSLLFPYHSSVQGPEESLQRSVSKAAA